MGELRGRFIGFRYATGIFAALTGILAAQAAEIYINDNSETNDHFCSATGSVQGDGTAAKPFDSIAHALAIAKAGDTLLVDAGTYELVPVEAADAHSAAATSLLTGEPSLPTLDVKLKRMKLIGAGPALTILHQAAKGAILSASAPGVEVRDLAISGGGIGIHVTSSDALLENLWIYAPANFGILVENTWGAIVRRCHIAGSAFRGLEITGGGGHTILQCASVSNRNAGYCLYNTTRNLLAANCAAANGTSGYFIECHSTRNALCGNTSYGSGLGGFYLFTDSTDNLLANNVARGNQRGFSTKNAVGNRFVNNVAEGNTFSQFQIRGIAGDNFFGGNIGALEIVAPTPPPAPKLPKPDAK